MSQQRPDEYYDDQGTEETGLNLFDDSASAAGSFTREMFGYDRGSVDSYVRGIEKELSTLKQLVRDLRHQVALAERTNGTTDYTRLGSHATGILRTAEAQAADLVTKAKLEAERIKEEGRRVAADLRANAQSEADDIRVAGLANLRQLREDLEGEQTTTIMAARGESQSIIAAARRQADALATQAKQNAANALQAAELQAEKIVAEARRSAADIEAAAKKSSEDHLAAANLRHTEITDKASTLLAEATRHHEQSAADLANQAEEAQQIRSKALAAAEKTKADAARDAETTIASAHRQAAMMKDRLEEQYAWRKEQLEREVAALVQRKGSIIAQLSNLRQLAGDAPLEFPDEDPFGSSDPREQQTFVRETLPPVQPVAAQPVADRRDADETRVQPRVDQQERTEVVQAGDGREHTQVFDDSSTQMVDTSDAEYTEVVQRDERR